MKLEQVIHNVDVKVALDALSIGALAGSMVHALPNIAAGLTVIWMTMRIGETLYHWFKGKPTDTKKD